MNSYVLQFCERCEKEFAAHKKHARADVLGYSDFLIEDDEDYYDVAIKILDREQDMPPILCFPCCMDIFSRTLKDLESAFSEIQERGLIQ